MLTSPKKSSDFAGIDYTLTVIGEDGVEGLLGSSDFSLELILIPMELSLCLSLSYVEGEIGVENNSKYVI